MHMPVVYFSYVVNNYVIEMCFLLFNNPNQYKQKEKFQNKKNEVIY